MKSLGFSNAVNKFVAILLMGYFAIFSPAIAIARSVNNTNTLNGTPVSAPVSVPVPLPTSTPTPTPTPTSTPIPAAPEMVYPVNGQTLDLEGAYMFKVKPVPGAAGYLFGLFQDNVMVYENWRDNRTLSTNGEFALWESNPFHAKFHAGTVTVWIRALVNNRWTDARIINITLKPRAKPVPTPTVKPLPTPIAYPKPVINSIWNSTGNFGKAASVYGSGFSTRSGKVVFYNQNNQAVASVYNIFPATLKVGKAFTITGNHFGAGGKVNFYKLNQTAAYSGINLYWSNSMIIVMVPANLQPYQTYGIQVRTDASGSKDSSLVYRYISKW